MASSSNNNAASSNQRYDALNAKMARVMPELESEYARYPLDIGSRWLDPKEKGKRGEPCFVKGPDVGLKLGYVFGRGKFGFGYYSLLTRYSYQNLYARLQNEMPACAGCCSIFLSQASRKELDEWDDVKRIVYARSVASVPNDAVAQSDALKQAQGTAQMWYNAGQNEQLAVNIVSGMNPGVPI